jgi:PAS domain-containing protein
VGLAGYFSSAGKLIFFRLVLYFSVMMNPFELSSVSNDAFREILQSMIEGIIVIDKEGKILAANPIAEEMNSTADLPPEEWV